MEIKEVPKAIEGRVLQVVRRMVEDYKKSLIVKPTIDMTKFDSENGITKITA